MSDQPTLYRWDNDNGYVDVESVGKIEVYSKWQTVDDTHTISIRTDKTLKPGTYEIVRLDDE